MPREILNLTLEEAIWILNQVLNVAAISEKEVCEAAMGKGSVAVAIVGSDGRLMSFAAMDNVLPVSIQLAQDKAYTAIMGQSDTMKWAIKAQTPAGLDGRNFSDARFTCFPGGVIIYSKKAEVVGAIGVSGRSGHEDNELAQYGARRFADKEQARKEALACQ